MFSTISYKGYKARIVPAKERYVLECEIIPAAVTFKAKGIGETIDEFKKRVDAYKLSGCW